DGYDDGAQKRPPGIVYWRVGVQGTIPGDPPYVPRGVTFAIRTDQAGTERVLKSVRDAVWSINPDLPIAFVRTLADVYYRSMAETSFMSLMLGIAGAIALALGVVGIYGVVSYAVTQRRREIAIRLALGAQQHELRH